MKRALATLLALCAAGPGAWALQGQSRPSGDALDQRVDLDLQSLYDDAELSAALRELCAAYPEFLRLDSLGTSRGGRELWVITAAASGDSDPSERAALLAVGARGAADAHGAEMVLFTLFELAQNHERDPQVAHTLTHNTLYFVPCLDPDRRAALLADQDAAQVGVRGEPDHNLPTRWSPWGDQGGPYPLSEPESRSLVAFLDAHPNVAIVQTYSGAQAERAERPGTDLPSEDLALYQALLARCETQVEEKGHLSAFPDLPDSSGSLLSYACLELGAFGFQCEVAGRQPGNLPQPYELYLLARRAQQLTLALAGALPRLACEPTAVVRLKSDQWQVDIALENRGLLPTASAQARRRSVVPLPRVRTQGVKLIGAALRAPGEESLRALARPTDDLSLCEVPGGGRVELRLVLSAPAEAQLELLARATRGGFVATTIPLR